MVKWDWKLSKGKKKRRKVSYLDHLLVDAKVSVGMEIGDVEISARRTRLVVNPNGVRVWGSGGTWPASAPTDSLSVTVTLLMLIAVTMILLRKHLLSPFYSYNYNGAFQTQLNYIYINNYSLFYFLFFFIIFA